MRKQIPRKLGTRPGDSSATGGPRAQAQAVGLQCFHFIFSQFHLFDSLIIFHWPPGCRKSLFDHLPCSKSYWEESAFYLLPVKPLTGLHGHFWMMVWSGFRGSRIATWSQTVCCQVLAFSSHHWCLEAQRLPVWMQPSLPQRSRDELPPSQQRYPSATLSKPPPILLAGLRTGTVFPEDNWITRIKHFVDRLSFWLYKLKSRDFFKRNNYMYKNSYLSISCWNSGNTNAHRHWRG